MLFETVPAELKPFIESGTTALVVKRTDLNGDSLPDYLLVLQKQKKKESDPEIEERSRPLLLIVRQKDGSLKTVKRNEVVVLGKTQGGTFGDPLESITAGAKTFTINHYGGSNWRWVSKITFNYSRIDKTWQLVRVEKSEYNTGEPNKVKTTIETSPKHYGKVDIADFNHDTYNVKNKRQN